MNLTMKRMTISVLFAIGVLFASISCQKVFASESDVLSAEEYNAQEENYIIRLVGQRTNKDLKISDWRICLKYLRDNYAELVNDSGVDREKIDSYINGYTLLEEDADMPDEKINNIIEPRAAYSPSKVTAYTNKYWNTHNPAYPNFDNKGGDCANFVSQALKAGGKTMKGTVATNFSNWFCRTKSSNELSKISSTWRGADAFGHYWMSNAKGYKNFSKSYFTSANKFKTVYNYGSAGDAISLLNSNGRPYHTVVVSYKEDSKLKCAAHTEPHKWKSVYNIVREQSANGIRLYKMK